MTTKEPDESMAEVAIASVEAVFDWKAYLKETFDYEVEDTDTSAKAEENGSMAPEKAEGGTRSHTGGARKK